MGNGNDDHDDDDDLTRLENLTDFLHEEDTDIDSIFENLSGQQSDSDSNNEIHDDESVIMDLDEIKDAAPDFPPAFPEEIQEEIQAENQADSLFDNGQEADEEQADPFATDSPFSFESENESENTDFLGDFELEAEQKTLDEIQDETPVEFQDDNFENNDDDSFEDTYSSPPVSPPAPDYHIPEKLTDLKEFASEFSYGKNNISAGNPPFSVILRNIKYQDDVEDIKRLLNEFGIMNESNQTDYERSLEMGALLISQISEFSAIILAHKFRRFDLDLEVGLSDEVNPPKSSDKNAKGLIKKETIKQNIKNRLNLKDSDFSIADIIMTTSQNIPNYKVLEYLGVHSAMSLVDEDDLLKLQYVDKTLRNQDEIFNLSIDEDDVIQDSSKSLSREAFLNYQKSFSLIFDELKIRLKQKAYSQEANAVLGVSFGVAPMAFPNKTSAQFSITCSATFARIIKE